MRKYSTVITVSAVIVIAIIIFNVASAKTKQARISSIATPALSDYKSSTAAPVTPAASNPASELDSRAKDVYMNTDSFFVNGEWVNPLAPPSN